MGADPESFGLSLKAFHTLTQDRAKSWPHTMLATSTHDTKRAEDVRLRIAVLSELPAAWRLALRGWRRMNRSKRVELDGRQAPSRNDEYLLYQTLIGAWPLGELDDAALEQFRARIEQYMLKAVREAKLETSWLNPNEPYERVIAPFVRALLTPGRRNPFFADIQALVRHIVRFGLLNSLSQTLIKIASPGVADFFQGCELWDLSLVDPDNRRPVDFALRQSALDELAARVGSQGVTVELARTLLENFEEGRAKLFVIWRGLDLRRSLEQVFTGGEYVALPAAGDKADHVVAFARRATNRIVIAVAPRLCYRLLDGAEAFPLGRSVWGATAVPLPADWSSRQWRNHFTGEVLGASTGEHGLSLELAHLLQSFPVALLVDEVQSAL